MNYENWCELDKKFLLGYISSLLNPLNFFSAETPAIVLF